MIWFMLLCCCCCTIWNSHALIVPQELPSLLSLVYSTVPQIKKGSDSRFGFGFRLGEHADMQILVELGPQTETRPIGASDSSTFKRNVKQSEYINKSNIKEEESSKWLKAWSHEMRNKMIQSKKQLKVSENDENIHSKQFIKTTPLISEKALKELQALYKINHQTKSVSNEKE